MEEEEKVGEKPELGLNEKYCSECGAIIKRTAEFCPKCGTRQFREQPYKNPAIAAVLSALIVGLGQIYNGQLGKGIGFIVLYLISLASIMVLIGFVLVPIVWIYGIYDAHKTAKEMNAGLVNT